MLGALAAVLYGLTTQLRVRAVEISGVEGQLAAAIERSVGHGEMTLAASDPAALRSRLLAEFPDLAELHISRQLPDRLLVEAVVRAPLALWVDEDQVIRLVDKDGTPYRPLARNDVADLPILRTSRRQLGEVGLLMGQLQAVDPALLASVSEVIAIGGDWKLNFDRGMQWLVPGGNDNGNRYRLLAELLHKPFWAGRSWHVDARSNERWYLRPARQGGFV